ncbi:L-2-hydroxyglutarate oxidase [Neolewinella antarctica]|uniref:L-2-hydroxyglutarate oxidase n=1 Tax=Neolewinella antarctica TaxID=442734 RepID=A0ABX0XHH6_9BACT|nr:L-2-hydroxyglutarate oxidase [Neolewinella antarctica]NJC28339.1 L-2-hydroxyglutarate oxidase [Neolewinella antarctica]
MQKTTDLLIIGGGIVGLATALACQRADASLKITVLEKEPSLATHQTGHNSGVLHSGVYYTPGSLKARMCRKGLAQMIEFAREHDIPHDICGKIITATEEAELPRLRQIMETGKQNGLSQLSLLDREDLKEVEPHCGGIAALHVPEAGIIDYRQVALKMAEEIERLQPRSRVLTGQEVRSITTEAGTHHVHTGTDKFQAAKLIVCGGLFADRLARGQGLNVPERIVGFRGDYYELTPQAQAKVRGLIYPVPDPAFPFLGVHFTKMIAGGVECGPNAVFTFKREGYGKTDFNLADTRDALGYAGTWKLFANHWRFGLKEYHRAFSKRQFLRTLQRLLPDLTAADIRPGRSGVRAVLLSPEGDTRSDFRILEGENSLHVLNAPSPAATASLAIGEAICLRAGFG